MVFEAGDADLVVLVVALELLIECLDPVREVADVTANVLGQQREALSCFFSCVINLVAEHIHQPIN